MFWSSRARSRGLLSSRMKPFRLIGLVLLGGLGACADGALPTTPAPPPLSARVVSCAADVRANTLTCSVPSSHQTSRISADLVLGGQGTYVALRSSSVSYDGTTTFRADVTVQNLTALPLGTSDGATVQGVKVFFHSGPTVTSGSGTVTVANPDGWGTFTGANQPYFLYNEILPTGQVSSGKTWQWSVPSTVTFFTFQVLVDAAVQDFFMLTVSVLGGGTVTSAPVGISCAAANNGMCSARFLSGASVTLSPNTAPGWAFSIAGWGGDCAGSGGSATLVMTQNRNCSVAFAPELTVSIAGSGTITSSPAGINCTSGNSGVCGTTFLFGTAVTLMATPASGRVFAGWSGDCTGTGDCMVLMSNVRRVGATFLSATGPATLAIGPKPLIIEVGAHPNIDVVVKDADGTVISNPTVTFASRNPLVAAFSPGGVLNGLARGQSVIVATASGGSAPADSLLAVVAVSGGPVVITDITQFNYGVG